jgi:hypothetical protein
MIARMRRNQTGVEQKRINWDQIKEAYLDYKTWLFTLLGFVANIPNELFMTPIAQRQVGLLQSLFVVLGKQWSALFVSSIYT